MIRINLLRSTGMSAAAPAFGADGSVGVVVVDQQKIGAMKLVAILIFPILLYVYETMNVSSLESQRADIEAQAAAVEAKNAAYGDVGPRVERYTKEKQRIDSQLGIIRELAKNRLREVKALDSLQSLTPPQVWFDTIKIEGSLVKATGYSVSDDGLGALFSSLNNSPVFSRFEPKAQSQTVSSSGERTVKFDVEFQIGGRQ